MFLTYLCETGLGVMVMFNATFYNILAISLWSVLLVEKTTEVSQINDKL